MASYKAPLRDMRFVYNELFDYSDISSLPGYEDATPDLVDAIIEEAAKVCENELFPINRSGDEEGCIFENGVVRTPKGFKEAYKAYVEGGWGGLTCDPKYGGQGMPSTIHVMVEEMMCSANLSFGIYPGLTYGAYQSLHAHGTDELRDLYLPKMVSGEWSGTMCLTEPHCGTDLGLLRSKAVPNDDGSWNISGTKIFISSGEHDLTDNIIHLVLARAEGSPKGIKGISLFVVPKFIPKDDGTPGPRNGVSCGSIEHKMGIKASATCVMNFEDAKGWLVGEMNKGMSHMFTMMNNERLAVGVQGLGLAESSYQAAVEYARERLQGRALTGAKNPEGGADPILVHPDIRRTLLNIRAFTEGARATAMWVARGLDLRKKHPDDTLRTEADDFIQLMTPMVKALFTDFGFEATNMGMQVFGGSGYIRETGVEQYVRDARIAQIYEGTNGIQALDMVGRKMPAHFGRFLRRFFHPVQAFIEEHAEDESMADFAMPLAKAFGRLQRATGYLAEKGMKNPDEAGAAASEYLRLFGLVAMAYIWARTAKVAMAKVDGDEASFYQAKLGTARHYMERILPQSSGLFSSIMAGSKTMMSFADDAF